MAVLKYKTKDGEYKTLDMIIAGGGSGTITPVQTTGDSETDVMSQKAVTDELNKCVKLGENDFSGSLVLLTSGNIDLLADQGVIIPNLYTSTVQNEGYPLKLHGNHGVVIMDDLIGSDYVSGYETDTDNNTYLGEQWRINFEGDAHFTDVEISGNTALHAGNSSVSKSGQTLTVNLNGEEASLTNTTYSAGTGISLSGTTFSHADTSSLSGSYGPTANVTGSNNATIVVPQITVDTYGHVTGVTNRTYTSVNTTYSAATTSAAGLMSAADKTKLDGITASADTVSFSRSLTSGTKIGTITINGTGTDLYCQTNTNTTYSAGTGISLSGTTFSLSSTYQTYCSNGNTAYGWGNHASAGYIKSYTDTKNTAGSTNSTSKLYLIGAASQEANPVTYSNSSCYMQSGYLYATSDERLKNFENDIPVDFNVLKSIPKKYFRWKENSENLNIGTSAQALQKVYPELVTTDENGEMGVNYQHLSVVALAAIDKLHEENLELKERIEKLEKLLNVE